jgi:hypothetical protein
MKQMGSLFSRRRLLMGLGGVAAGAVALMASPFRATIGTATRALVSSQPTLRGMFLSLADGGYQDWLDQVGSTFSIGGGTSMKLIGVTPFGTAGTRPASLSRDSAFIAKFDVQNGQTMAGDLIYTASNADYGAFQIFLSASTDPATRSRMTAVFN